MRLGYHVHDLIEGAADKVHELELSHGTHAGKRRAKSRAHNGRLGNRRINHALRAKVVDKSISHFERAAINANVFTNAEDGGVGLHLFPEPLPYCFEISCLRHKPFAADYAARPRSKNFLPRMTTDFTDQFRFRNSIPETVSQQIPPRKSVTSAFIRGEVFALANC